MNVAPQAASTPNPTVSGSVQVAQVIFYTSFLNLFINYANMTVLSQYNNFHSNPITKNIYGMLSTTRFRSFESSELLKRYCLLLDSI